MDTPKPVAAAADDPTTALWGCLARIVVCEVASERYGRTGHCHEQWNKGVKTCGLAMES